MVLNRTDISKNAPIPKRQNSLKIRLSYNIYFDSLEVVELI